MIDVQVHPDGPLARTALRQRLRALQATDPVRPVTVAVSSNYAGLALRRALARPEGDDRGGLLNIRFIVLARVIELLGAPLLAAEGQRPLTSLLRGEFIRSALQREPGVFAPVAGHPATEQRLDETFRELAELTDEARASLAATGEQAADVVRLFEVVRSESAGRYYDDAALAVAAARAAREQHPALRDVGALVIYAPRPLTANEQGFLEALGAVEEVTVLLTATGDALADGPVLAQWSQRQPASPAAAGIPYATHIVSAPDAEEEVRQALRMVFAQLEAGVPLHRMALLSRHASPYAALAAGQLNAAELPWNGALPRTLAQTVAGRVLLGLLALPASRFARTDVCAWLGAAPILQRADERERVPAPRWDGVARSAGIVRGREEWLERLDLYIGQSRRDLEAIEQDDNPADWRRAGLEREIEEAEAFLEFMVELFGLLERPASGDWASVAEWALLLLERYAGTEPALTDGRPEDDGTDREIESYRAVRAALESMAGLAEVRATVDLATFTRVLQRELERPAGRTGRFGEGIFVGRLSDAAGGDFDHIFILGMNEGAIPTKGSDDPLVPEAAWERLPADGRRASLSRRERNRSEERRAYLAALASAPFRTLLAPRADLRGQQGRLRSRWLLESASHLAAEQLTEGQRLTNEDMEHLDSAWHTLVPSFDGALTGGHPPTTLAERDLRALRAWHHAGRPMEQHPLAIDTPDLLEGWTAQRERRSARFTRWDGHAVALNDTILLSVIGREQSPTSLERWASCPRQYLFASVLRIAQREDPDDLLTISPADRGTLIHEVLERFIAERRPATPETPWSADDRRRLDEITTEECDRAEQAGITGVPLLWRLERARIQRELAAFASVDEAHRIQAGVVPVATELAFGGEVPVTVDLGNGRVVKLRGRIDRVDRSPDGERIVVIDYKSGSPNPYKNLAADPVRGGRLLQLPVYALGARAVYGDGGKIESRYWFTREPLQPGERFAGYPVDGVVEKRFRQALRTIVDGIADGVFPGTPGTGPDRNGTYESCRWCAYDAVCGADRAREHTRKIDDRALIPLLSLSGIETSDEEDEA